MSVLTQILMQGTVGVQNLRDIKPPLEVPQSSLPYVLMGGFILAVVAIVCWHYLRKRDQSVLSPPLQESVTLAPHEIAYKQLDVLEAATSDMAVYHTRISYVIREYVAARYRIPALELTTTGLLERLVRAQIGSRYITRIAHFLDNCDKVKFATYHPERSEAVARMADARWIVEETKVPAP